MANNVAFSPDQVAALRRLLAQYAAASVNDTASVSPLLKQAYDDVNQWIHAALALDPQAVDSDTQLFFSLAVEVNQNELGSAANTYIRTVTHEGLVATPGADSSADAIQRTSNRIAVAIFNNLIDEFGLPATVDDLIAQDDFRGLVSAFDAAQAQSPGLTSWDVTNALLENHLAGSDDSALGGDLAYWYGRNGSFAGISLQAAQQVIGASGFGSDAQALRPFSGLQDGFVKLS